MTTSRGVPLRITCKITDESSTLTMTPFQGEPLVVEGDLSKKALGEQRKSLRNTLDHFKNLIGNEVQVSDWKAISQSIELLHEQGRRLAWQLFGQRLKAVLETFEKAYPKWTEDIVPVPFMEVTASIDDAVPVEFLPLFNIQVPGAISNPGDLIRALRSFIGFSIIVKRVILRTQHAGKTPFPVLENVPRLPVKLFHHDGLPGVKDEIDFFLDMEKKGWVDLEWLQHGQIFNGPEPFINNIADHLLNPERRFNGMQRKPPDQIHHFSCHCYTTSELSEDYWFELSHNSKNSYKVTIGKLQARFATLTLSDEALPLVFFNACGTSMIDPGAVASFPRLFLVQIGSRGFIGTETRIPDAFAAAFSQRFYTELLRGRRLGQAFHNAKRTLLTRYNNPLGILYTVYADPDIRVEKRPH